MTSEEELGEALIEYEQAEERVRLEYQNWTFLQVSYHSLMQSLQGKGLTPKKAKEQFDSYMSSHASSFSASLEHRNGASSRLVQVLNKFPHLLPQLPSRAKRGLGI